MVPEGYFVSKNVIDEFRKDYIHEWDIIVRRMRKMNPSLVSTFNNLSQDAEYNRIILGMGKIVYGAMERVVGIPVIKDDILKESPIRDNFLERMEDQNPHLKALIVEHVRPYKEHYDTNTPKIAFLGGFLTYGFIERALMER